MEVIFDGVAGDSPGTRDLTLEWSMSALAIMRQLSMAMNAFYSKLRKYEDGSKLRRYKRRWSVKRTNAWLDQFRRLLLRHEHLLATYRTFVYLAYLGITLRRCL